MQDALSLFSLYFFVYVLWLQELETSPAAVEPPNNNSCYSHWGIGFILCRISYRIRDSDHDNLNKYRDTFKFSENII